MSLNQNNVTIIMKKKKMMKKWNGPLLDTSFQ